MPIQHYTPLDTNLIGGIFSCLFVQMFVLPTPKTKWTFHILYMCDCMCECVWRTRVNEKWCYHIYVCEYELKMYTHTPFDACKRNNRHDRVWALSNNDTAVKWKIVYVDFNWFLSFDSFSISSVRDNTHTHTRTFATMPSAEPFIRLRCVQVRVYLLLFCFFIRIDVFVYSPGIKLKRERERSTRWM